MTGFPLYHCDNPLHGYCFHLDDDVSKLTNEEKSEWNELKKYFEYVETPKEADEEIRDAEREIDKAAETLQEWEGTLEDLKRWKELLIKKDSTTPREFIADAYTNPMGLDR